MALGHGANAVETRAFSALTGSPTKTKEVTHCLRQIEVSARRTSGLLIAVSSLHQGSSMTSFKNAALRRLPFITGSASALSFVECPKTHDVAEVDACRKCPRCWFVQQGSLPETSFVVCDTQEPAGLSGMPLESGNEVYVAEIMSRPVYTVAATTSIRELIALLAAENINGVPVVEKSGRLVGSVSAADVISEWADAQNTAGTPGDPEGTLAHEFQSRAVCDVMTKPAIKVPTFATVSDVAMIMSRRLAHQVAVVDEADHLVGVVSYIDVVTWVANAGQKCAQRF